MKRKTPAKAAAPDAAPVLLLYKVVELSNVDESSMEETVNTWVRQGWSFDGVQFAMRESSKRPSMAFVFFTRKGHAAEDARGRGEEAAQQSLRRLAEPLALAPSAPAPVSAWDRLAQLAADDEDGT